MKEDSIIGIDLAKNVFHVCVMNGAGRVVKRKKLSRSKLFEYVVSHCEGVVAMEACGGAQYWARRFEELGYEVRQMAGQFVKPFVKSNKNDEIDAEAICEAASRPQMRFVSTRSEYQQDMQNIHRIRERLVGQRTALANEVRGLLIEYGIVVPKGIGHVRNSLHGIIEQQQGRRSELWCQTFMDLYEELLAIDARVEQADKRIRSLAQSDETCKRLLQVPGVGQITATAIVAAVGDPSDFNNGRQFAAWLGLTPKQHSTGGKTSLGRISKRGDKYLRKLLVQGANSSAIAAERKRNNKDPLKRELNQTQKWLFELAQRRGSRKAVVALANKTARRIWVVMMGEDFKQPEELLSEAA